MPTGRSRVAIIFFTVLIDLVGFGIVIPILPYYAQSLGAGGFGLGALFGVYSLMQFFGTSLLGTLSDRVGRRPWLLPTLIIHPARHVLLAFPAPHPLPFPPCERGTGGWARVSRLGAPHAMTGRGGVSAFCWAGWGGGGRPAGVGGLARPCGRLRCAPGRGWAPPLLSHSPRPLVGGRPF